MARTTLYRLHAADGRLLYVGIAGNPGRRFEQHAQEKDWWGEVATIHVEHFVDREAAISAEVVAIDAERPAYNIAGNIHGRCEACGAPRQGLSIYCSQRCAKSHQTVRRKTRAAPGSLTLTEIAEAHRRAVARLKVSDAPG